MLRSRIRKSKKNSSLADHLNAEAGLQLAAKTSDAPSLSSDSGRATTSNGFISSSRNDDDDDTPVTVVESNGSESSPDIPVEESEEENMESGNEVSDVEEEASEASLDLIADSDGDSSDNIFNSPILSKKSKQSNPEALGPNQSSTISTAKSKKLESNPSEEASSAMSFSRSGRLEELVSNNSFSLSQNRRQDHDSRVLLESSSDSELEENVPRRPPNSRAESTNCSSNFQGDSVSQIQDLSDPDWIKFTEYVNNCPEGAHDRLAIDFMKAGTDANKLLGKLIFRCLNKCGATGAEVADPHIFEKYAATILKGVLTTALRHAHENSNTVVVDLVTMTFVELRHFPTDVLYSIAESCLEYMKKDKDGEGYLPPRWIDIFGKVVSTLVERGGIKHETDVIDGRTYMRYVITEICRMRWSTENSTSLIAVFGGLPELEDAELKMILQQVRTCVSNFKASAFPPIMHQLISLAGSKCTFQLLCICSEYFGNVSDATPLELRQKRHALGTVVFHFLEAARHSDVLLKTASKIIKASLFDFGQVMNPFIVSVILGLTTYEQYRPTIIDPLRHSILKCFQSYHVSQMSCWYNRISGDHEDMVTKTFRVILESKSSEVDFMFTGLLELGLGLLNADQFQNKYPNTLEKCQELGTFLITSVVQSTPAKLSTVIKRLLSASSKSSANIQCLASCLSLRARQMISSTMIGRACEVVRLLPTLDATSAGMLVKALSGALQNSYTLLDALMVVLRKTVLKSLEARRAAAKVMIVLLSNAKVVGDIPFSQYSESQRLQGGDALPSQTFDQLPDNKPLCVEILGLAKRCLGQQSEVRKELYLGFHSVIRKNPALCELVCAQVFQHVKQFLSDDDNGEPAELRFGAMFEFPMNEGALPTIKEELGFLVQCMGFVVDKSYKVFQSNEDGPPAAVLDLETKIRKIIDAVLAITPEAIEIAAAQLVGNAGGCRPLETVRYVETALNIQMMQVIEALIEFLFSDRKSKDSGPRVVKKLFQKYKIIEESLKKEKPKQQKGKGDKKGGKDKSKANKENSVDDIDALSDTSSSLQGGRFKKPNEAKKLVYYNIMNLESVLDMLRKLYKTDSDKGMLALVHDDNQNEFETLLLSIARKKLASYIRKESLHERSRQPEKILEIFADIAGAAWNGLLKRNPDGDIHDVTGNAIIDLRLEVVKEISGYLCSLQSPVTCHLVKVLGDEDQDDKSVMYEQAFQKFLGSWKTLLGWLPMSTNENETKSHEYLFHILMSFSKPLATQSAPAIELTDWLWNYLSGSVGKAEPDFQLAETVCTCWLTYFMKGKGFLEQPEQSQHDVLCLAKAVCKQLGINEEVENSEHPFSDAHKLWIVNEETVSTIFCQLLNHIEIRLGHITVLLGKLKFHQAENELVPGKDAEIRETCFDMLNQILKVCHELIIADFPAGLCATTMMNVIPQIFDLLCGFAEYFTELLKTKKNFSIKGFAAPVNSVSKDFQSLVEKMVQHVEIVQRIHTEEAVANNPSKKSKGRTVLPSVVKNRLILEKKLIPGVIFSIEKYDLQILALSQILEKKGKKGVFLRAGMKMSNLRDFKIDHQKFSKALETANPRPVQDMSTVPDITTQGDGGPNATARQRKRNANAPSRPRKSRKRKPSESEEQNEEEEEQSGSM